MRTPYYQSPERQQLLLAELISWIGTPFKSGAAAVKGPYGGVDCIGLCIAVNVACGACSPIECERLPLDWHHHHDTSAILTFFNHPGLRERLQILSAEDPLMPGDLVAVQTGRCVHHLGIVMAGHLSMHLVHVPIDACAQMWAFEPLLASGMVKSVWRIMEVSQ